MFNNRHWIIQQELHAVYNLCAPNPVSNAHFTRALAQTLKRPALLPMPSYLIKLMFGEIDDLLLDSQRVIPKQLQQKGFCFRYETLEAALQVVYPAKTKT